MYRGKRCIDCGTKVDIREYIRSVWICYKHKLIRDINLMKCLIKQDCWTRQDKTRLKNELKQLIDKNAKARKGDGEITLQEKTRMSALRDILKKHDFEAFQELDEYSREQLS